MLVGEKKQGACSVTFVLKQTNKQKTEKQTEKNLLETRLSVRYETLEVGQEKGNK